MFSRFILGVVCLETGSIWIHLLECARLPQEQRESRARGKAGARGKRGAKGKPERLRGQNSMTPKRAKQPEPLPLVGPQIPRPSKLRDATRVQYTYCNPVPDPRLDWFPLVSHAETIMERQRKMRVQVRGKVKI